MKMQNTTHEKRPLISLFLDSGAHSFYMQSKLKGITLSENEYEEYFSNYISFIKSNKEFIDVYVNLDIINDPVCSYKNYLRMKHEGLDPIAVVHPGEDPSWVKKYLDLGCNYIGLGGLGQFYTSERYKSWADVVWSNYLLDSKGFPIVKVHGFAMTSLKFMLEFPWFSVDSTSWIMGSRHGVVYLSIHNVEEPLRLNVSNRSPKKVSDTTHLVNLSPYQLTEVTSYLEAIGGYKIGKSEFKVVPKNYSLMKGERNVKNIAELDSKVVMSLKISNNDNTRVVEVVVVPGVTNDYRTRDEVNIIFYKKFEEWMNKNYPWPWSVKTKKMGRKTTKTLGFRF